MGTRFSKAESKAESFSLGRAKMTSFLRLVIGLLCRQACHSNRGYWKAGGGVWEEGRLVGGGQKRGNGSHWANKNDVIFTSFYWLNHDKCDGATSIGPQHHVGTKIMLSRV